MYRSIHGDAAVWGPTEHLLAAAVDALHGANWQRGGGKGHRPKPVERPGQDTDRKFRPEKGRPLEEMRRFLDDWNSGRLEKTHKPKGTKVVT